MSDHECPLCYRGLWNCSTIAVSQSQIKRAGSDLSMKMHASIIKRYAMKCLSNLEVWKQGPLLASQILLGVDVGASLIESREKGHQCDQIAEIRICQTTPGSSSLGCTASRNAG